MVSTHRKRLLLFATCAPKTLGCETDAYMCDSFCRVHRPNNDTGADIECKTTSMVGVCCLTRVSLRCCVQTFVKHFACRQLSPDRAVLESDYSIECYTGTASSLWWVLAAVSAVGIWLCHLVYRLACLPSCTAICIRHSVPSNKTNCVGDNTLTTVKV